MGAPESDDAVGADSIARPARFAVLYERHLQCVAGYLARRAGSELAEDLTAEGFARAFRGRPRSAPSMRLRCRGCWGSRGAAAKFVRSPFLEGSRCGSSPGSAACAWPRSARRPSPVAEEAAARAAPRERGAEGLRVLERRRRQSAGHIPGAPAVQANAEDQNGPGHLPHDPPALRRLHRHQPHAPSLARPVCARALTRR